MKKRRRAWLSMILTWVFIVVILIILIAIPLLAKGRFIAGNETNMLAIAGALASLILTIIQLCIIAIAIYGLHHYFHYYRPSVFIFKGFSNGSKLTEIDHVPVDLDNLAREELAYQFWLIYKKLGGSGTRNPPKRENDSDHAQQSSANQIDLYTEEIRSQDEDEWPLPSLEVERGILGTEKAKWLRRSLEKTMENSKTVDLSDLVNAIERTAPQGMASIMNFMDVIFPARAITVTCHLQWRGDCSDGIGITFEVTDSKKKGGVSFTQTIWSNSTISADAHKKLTERYIELLKPAMRWLGLLFWELNMPQGDKKGLLPAFFYLFGVLCYDWADCFPVCSNFFSQQARKRLSKVTNKYPNLSLPYFMRAEINVWKAYRAKAKNKHACPLFQQAIHDYDQALDDKQWENSSDQAINDTLWRNSSQASKNWIISRRALAVLRLKDEYLIDDTCGQVEKMQVEEMIKEGDPTSSEGEIEECSLCLSNLADWYAKRAEEYKRQNETEKEKEAKAKVRPYLIYSLVRNPRSWYYEKDENSRYEGFQDFFEQFDEQFKEYLYGSNGEKLWTLLEENRPKVLALAKLPGKDFSREVDDLFKSWWELGTSASAENPSTNDANSTNISSRAR